MDRRTALLCMILAVTGGCSRKTGPASSAEFSRDSALQFLDSRSFDREFSRLLRDASHSVTVTFLGGVTVNDIPKRMEEWLAKAEKEGGEVSLEIDPDSTNTKSISLALAGITVAVTAYSYLRGKRLYSPVGEYDATVYHLAGQATISRIVFTRKTLREVE